MNYRLNVQKFKSRLIEGGYRNLADFAAKTKIHRNTLQTLLAGKNVFSASLAAVANALKTDPLEIIEPRSAFSAKIESIDEIRPIVARLIQENPQMAVVLLGSRVRGKARTYSDWDIGVSKYPDALSGREYLKLKGLAEELSESLVRTVDLVNLNQAPGWFLEGVGRDILFLDGNEAAFTYLKGLLDGIQKEKAA